MVDYTILYVLAVVVGTIGLIFLFGYLGNKKIITKEQMSLVSSILGLGIEIVKDLKIKEPLIVEISGIVRNAVDLAVNELDGGDVVALAEKFAIEQCVKIGIDLTNERKQIIKELVVMVLKNK